MLHVDRVRVRVHTLSANEMDVAPLSIETSSGIYRPLEMLNGAATKTEVTQYTDQVLRVRLGGVYTVLAVGTEAPGVGTPDGVTVSVNHQVCAVAAQYTVGLTQFWGCGNTGFTGTELYLKSTAP
jgi:hypothetical protein